MCIDHLSHATAVSVGDALKIPELRRGVPEVLAHEAGLANEIRWVHASEVSNIASLLRGGELLLSTGMGLDRAAAGQDRLVRELAERRIAALVIELGSSLRVVPRGLLRAAERHGLCLIALNREVRFVEVTEAIHRMLIDQGGELLRRADRLHRRFTALMLGGAGVTEVLAELARFVRNPVFLERAGHGLAYHARHESDDETALGAWAAFSRGLATAPEATEERVPLGGEESWGRLVVLALDGPLDGQAQVAVERAVGLIALALMRREEEDHLSTRQRGDFLLGLTGTRAGEAEVAARAAELGFSGAWERLLPLAAGGGDPRTGPPGDVAWVAVKRDLRLSLDRARIPAILGDGEDGELLFVVGLRHAADRERVAGTAVEMLREALTRRIGSAPPPTVAVAGAAAGWREAGLGLRTAVAALEAAGHEERRPWHDVTEPSPDRLLYSLRDSADLREFTEQRLRPLIEADSRGRGELVRTLGTLCDNAGRRAETAAALEVKRQSLYHRLNRIEEITGCDLSDGDVLLSFHVALRARRFLELA
ncbi:MAG: PucR family transcriptional regulator [Actinobacteria bacterium]|nr:PucR family transcriptional regulator [Actinomycetota bacterium]